MDPQLVMASENPKKAESIYEFSAKDIDGNEVRLPVVVHSRVKLYYFQTPRSAWRSTRAMSALS